MSFNRRGGGPDRRPDRPPRREGGDRYAPRGGFPQRDRPSRPEGGDRYAPRGGFSRDQGARQEGADRDFQPRGGDRPYTPRPRFDRAPDEGAMSIRLDPRRVNALKHLAGEAGVRPGDLVRQWVEERIDAARKGEGGVSLEDRIAALEARISALEPNRSPDREAVAAATIDQAADDGTPEGQPEADPSVEPDVAATRAAERGKRRRQASAAPSERVALHDEMIAVIREHGPMTTGELAAAITERGRYAPPRSGKALDAAMISQRVSNPTYRSRFVRREGRIGLAD